LFKAIHTSIRIDLLAVKKLMDRPKEMNFAGEVAALVTDARIDSRAIVLSLLILGGTYGYTYYRQLPLKRDIQKSITNRAEVTTVNAGASYGELVSVSKRYQEKLSILDKFVRKQLYFTELLNLLPAAMPEGTWLLKLNFNQQDNKAQLELQCIAFSIDNDKGMRLANDFFMNLKKNNSFMKFFKDANITSMKQNLDRGLVITRFSISCRGA
jgi:hypothetical protein